MVHKTAEIQDGAIIGKNVRIWQNSQVLSGAVIGDDCVVGHNCLVSSKAKLGKGVKLQSNIDVWDLVELEDYVFVGPSAVFTNDKNPRAKYPKSEYSKYGKWLPTLVREGATIGANTTVICGNTIGRWSMIGAGALVGKNIPDYAVAVGVPAEIVGWICECGNKLDFKDDKTVCAVCNRKYKKEDDKVWEIK
jgi:UDP-2-acetamido-3-amino-2,3-dideoxy-glucuronate N-acetyltransferase